MIISLAGYMGCGKSHVSKLLSEKLSFKLVDLDKEITKKNKATISEIFKLKGEIFFRKEERLLLESILKSNENIILSLGGGTPAYYDNMKLVNLHSKSFFLQAKISTLVERLSKQKEKRPLIAKIADENLPEFIAKHLFERNAFYNQCQFTIATDNKLPESIVHEIIQYLNHH